jgi:hypothetical protein
MMRHLRVWKPGGQPVGTALVRIAVGVCLVMAALRLEAETLHLELARWPGPASASTWYGPGQLGQPRARVEAMLDRLPGQPLVIVRYSPQYSPLDEWVYNAPDIDHSKIIWARDMDTASNKELLDYYKDRTVWLVQPDIDPVSLSAYSAQQ